MHWSNDVNIGQLAELLAGGIALWAIYSDNRRRSEKMHSANERRLTALETQVSLLVNWFQRHWGNPR